MPNYRRAFLPGGCWFFTVNVLERKGTHPVDHIGLLRESVAGTRRKYPLRDRRFRRAAGPHACDLDAAAGRRGFSTRWRLIKTAFAKSLPKQERLSAVRKARNARGIWQRRFWEHMIRNDTDYARHIEYCYINPVKHGLVTRVRDWPHSSFHRDVERGTFPLDWAGDVATGGEFGEPL
jgi:putative transposase